MSNSNKLNPNYINLHCHSIGSLRDGIMKISDHIKYAIDNKKKYVPITDHGSISEWIELYTQCKKHNLIPIFGIEGYVHLDREKFLTDKEGKPNHLVLIAQNEQGYKNIIKIHNDAWKHFYRKPIMSYEYIFNNSEGIILTSACLGGTVSRLLSEKKIKELDDFLKLINEKMPNKFFIELQLIDYKEQLEINPQLIQIAKKHNIPTIITNDAHYLDPEDNKEHQLSLLLQSNKTVKDLEDGKGWKFSAQDLWLKNEKQLYNEWLKWYKNDPIFTEEILLTSLNNTNIITDPIEQLYLEHPPRLPHYKNGYEILEDIVIKGFESKIKDGYIPKDKYDIYIERMEHELKTIKDMELIDYFLLINDIVNFCWNNNVAVGPGRGSVSASLITYLMGITKLDPIRHRFIFERFLNPARKTRLKFF